jgi:drug/metabolite transporter (DMT)-like permease
MDRLLGVFLVVFSAACFGANPVFARIGYDAGANPVTFLFIRFIIASVVMWLIMIVRGLKFPRGRMLVSLALIGGIGLTGTTLSYYSALQYAPINLVVVIAYVYPALVALLSAVFLKQPITAHKFAGLLMTFVGILCTVGPDTGGHILGIMLAMVAAVFYSIYLVFGSLSIQNAGPFAASTVVILSSTALDGIFVAMQGSQLPTHPSGWLAVVASALVSTVLGLLALFAGLKRIDTANTAIISTFEVVVSVALAVIFLGETISLPKIIGGCLIVSAVFLLAKGEYRAVTKAAGTGFKTSDHG